MCGVWFIESMFYWLQTFNLIALTPDHLPVMVNTNLEVSNPWKHHFHFENEWLFNVGLSDVIESSWRSDDISFLQKIERYAKALYDWGRNQTGDFKRKLTRLYVEAKHYKNGAILCGRRSLLEIQWEIAVTFRTTGDLLEAKGQNFLVN